MLTREQYEYLLNPLRSTRIKSRSQGGKDLHYLEAWDVRAHLIRIFGFGNFDVEVVDQHQVNERHYQTTGDNPRPMVEVSWFAKVRLVIRDNEGLELCRFAEGAVGSTSGPETMVGEHHDNALKSAASDALKRCATNLGTQFGLSLYDNGSRDDVVRATLIHPDPVEGDTPSEATGADLSAEASQALAHSLGATPVEEKPVLDQPDDTSDETSSAVAAEDGPQFERKIDTPEQTAEQIAQVRRSRASKAAGA